MSLRLMSAVLSTTSTAQNKVEDADILLRELLICVQSCQKQYGGKTLLATEFDNCVIALCATLENVFAHGLRKTLLESQQLSTLKQVVANSLNIGSDNPSFWPFINKHLTKHEQERYAVLKQIWTDIGRGRAWIRSALNERSLERYFHTILNKPNILKTYYEDWALLRDEEKSCMLPNMAAGLGAILFAISIDKPELNSCSSRSSAAVHSKPEPIIEAPLTSSNKNSKLKKKKKVARQFISFDEDMPSSGSNPSNAGSVSSDTSSLTEHPIANTSHSNCSPSALKEEIPQDTDSEDTDSVADPADKKLPDENCGSRNKFPTETPGSLTPVSQSEIGELTPISVEVNAHFESPDVSDDILEVPSDISAVLTAVENKNQEERSRLQVKIDKLLKENKVLSERIKKYVSAMQMLKQDDQKVEDVLKELQIEGLPDYKSEAKLFEQKLVQVADMHAELMDFNVHLQQSLCKKDTLLERLRQELESLRGPMPTNALNSDESLGNVNIWIPSAFLTGSGSNSHHVYQIFLRVGNEEWNIYRRYAQFHALHTDLKKLDPAISTFDFPPKKSIGKKDSGLVEERRKRLQKYLRRILNHWPELSHCSSRYLLEQHLTFFKDQKEKDEMDKKSMFSSRRSGATDTHNHSGL